MLPTKIIGNESLPRRKAQKGEGEERRERRRKRKIRRRGKESGEKEELCVRVSLHVCV